MSVSVGQASAGSSVGPQVAASAFTQTQQYTADLGNGVGTVTAITPDSVAVESHELTGES